MIISISWRNIWRNKTRSLVILVAIALGIFAGVFSVAFMYGAVDQRVNSVINTEVSHIQLHQPDYLKTNDIKDYIESIDKKQKAITNLPEVQAASSRIIVNAMVSTAETGTGIQLLGIEPENEKKVTNIHEKLVKGSYFEKDIRNSIVIGKALADKLNAKIKSKLVITTQENNGTLTGGAFRVVGIYNTGNTMYDETKAFVRDKDLSKLVKLDKGYGHEIAVLLGEDAEEKAIAAKLSDQYPGLKVMTWKEIMPEMQLVAESMDYMMYLFVGIILLALGFGIVNTMLMVIMERVKELGMLMAIGMNRLRVFMMIVLETVFLSLTGAAVGMAFAAGVIMITKQTGLDVSMYAEGLNSVGFSSIIYPSIDVMTFVEVTILVIIVGIIAAIYPAMKAIKMKPAEAIRIDN